jgi:hypothetical protein
LPSRPFRLALEQQQVRLDLVTVDKDGQASGAATPAVLTPMDRMRTGRRDAKKSPDCSTR